MAEQVAEASGSNFLYLHHYAEGIRAGDEKLVNVEGLPKSLYGIYGYFLGRIRKGRGDVRASAH